MTLIQCLLHLRLRKLKPFISKFFELDTLSINLDKHIQFIPTRRLVTKTTVAQFGLEPPKDL